MKMRYLTVLLLSAILLVGCGNNTTTKNGNTAVDAATETEHKENLADMMETKEYSCTVDDSFIYYVMYVTNNSDKVVSIDLNVTALDSSGGMVGSSSDGTKAVAPHSSKHVQLYATYRGFNRYSHSRHGYIQYGKRYCHRTGISRCIYRYAKQITQRL